jgi:hypothetical protein
MWIILGYSFFSGILQISQLVIDKNGICSKMTKVVGSSSFVKKVDVTFLFELCKEKVDTISIVRLLDKVFWKVGNKPLFLFLTKM